MPVAGLKLPSPHETNTWLRQPSCLERLSVTEIFLWFLFLGSRAHLVSVDRKATTVAGYAGCCATHPVLTPRHATPKHALLLDGPPFLNFSGTNVASFSFNLASFSRKNQQNTVSIQLDGLIRI